MPPLNADAEPNIVVMFSTELVSQPERSALNAFAKLNIESIRVTKLTSQAEMSVERPCVYSRLGDHHGFKGDVREQTSHVRHLRHVPVGLWMDIRCQFFAGQTNSQGD